MNLFLDTTSNKLIIILEENNQIVDSLIIENQNRISDVFFYHLIFIFKKNNIKINDIKNFYIINGPGSYIGCRISLTLVKTIKVLNNNINLFVLSSLEFQLKNDKNTLSLISASNNKFYLGEYKNFQLIDKYRVIDKNELEKLKYNKKYINYGFIINYENINYKEQYLLRKDNFKSINDIKDFKPLYIKSFI